MSRYNIIYADPPWTYRDKCHSGERGAGYKYPLMSIEEIKALPVQNIAAPDCALFLWVTMPLLQEGLDTLRAWGFKYKTNAFTWIKTNRVSGSLFWGMGNWTRSNAELCLLGTKGKPWRLCAGVHSVVMAPIGEHSAKPPEVRDRIVELCGDQPRIELFARSASPGWDVFGNQVNGSIDLFSDLIPVPGSDALGVSNQ